MPHVAHPGVVPLAWEKTLSRGVYKLPARGPDGEFILFAVTEDHRLTSPWLTIVPFGGGLVAATEQLEAELQQYTSTRQQPGTAESCRIPTRIRLLK